MIRARVISTWATLLAVLLITSWVPLIARAQDSEGLEIKPAVTEQRVTPGQSYSFSVSVKNIAGVERTLYLVARDITGLTAQGLPVFAQPGEISEYALSAWVRLPEESVVLAPDETRSISYTVVVPQNANPGSHFGGVFFEMEPPRLRESGSGIGVSVGSIISLRVAGDVVEDARLREFSTTKLVYSTPDISFTTRVENLGNTLLRPNGFIEITDMFGTQVANVTVNQTGAPVFPKSDRIYGTDWRKDGFAFGRYQAIVSLAYGEDERRTISGATTFWILPLKPILLTLGSILGIVLIVFGGVRYYIRKKLQEMGITSRRADTGYYARRYKGSSSKLMFVLMSLVIVSVFFLIILFLLFS